MNRNTRSAGKKTFRQVKANHDSRNREAAELFLSEPSKHLDVQIQWAHLFLARHGLKPRARVASDLFGEVRG